MAKENAIPQAATEKIPAAVLETIPLWQLDIAELTGHNLEARGCESTAQVRLAASAHCGDRAAPGRTRRRAPELFRGL